MRLSGPFPDIDVHSDGAEPVLRAFAMFPLVLKKHLVARGIPVDEADGHITVPPGWIPLDNWLAVMRALEKDIGANALFQIGTRIMANTRFPPAVADIEGALRAIDAAYHLTHRLRGRVMLDTETGHMLEGIGHYAFGREAGRKVMTITCDTPYPCSSELGVVTGVASRFDRRASVAHAKAPACRDEGGERCVYVVTC